MDTKSKVIFLREVLARKNELFSKTDSKHKDELWHEVYDVCVSKGCIGLRDAEYLRRTTYQNLQRRAKEKYEKGLKIGMEHVNLSEVDEIILDIIGRDKCVPPPDLLNDDNFQTLLGFITKNEPTTNGFNNDSIQNSPYSLPNNDDEKPNGYHRMKTESPLGNGHAQSPESEHLDLQPKLPEVITSLFQSFVTNNTNGTTSSINHLNSSQLNGIAKRKRPISADESEDDEELIDEQLLQKRKLNAEIRLINAQTLVQEREAKLKDLQILALKRELGINN